MIHSSSGAALHMTNVDAKGAWTKKDWCSGPGYIVEAQVTDKRRHTVKPLGAADLPTRFLAIQAKVFGDILRREFEADGSERAPTISTTEKNFKGYLHHYNKTDAKAQNTAPISELADANKKLISAGLIPSNCSGTLHPKAVNVIEFWAELDQNLTVDFKAGDSIRLKTVGNSTIVENFTVINRLSSNTFAAGGTSTLDSWTSNIAKSSADAEPEPETAADDDEWA